MHGYTEVVFSDRRRRRRWGRVVIRIFILILKPQVKSECTIESTPRTYYYYYSIIRFVDIVKQNCYLYRKFQNAQVQCNNYTFSTIRVRRYVSISACSPRLFSCRVSLRGRLLRSIHTHARDLRNAELKQ